MANAVPHYASFISEDISSIVLGENKAQTSGVTGMDQDGIFSGKYRKMIETFRPLPEKVEQQPSAILERLCLDDNCGHHQSREDIALTAK